MTVGESCYWIACFFGYFKK